MKRKWQPGDFATASHESGEWRAFFYRDHNDNDALKYMWDDGPGDYAEHAQSDLTPLAVIDPAAPVPDEWVDVFESGCASAKLDSGLTDRDVIAAGLAALFAHIANPQPPRPPEPTGELATVRDAKGDGWVRDNRGDEYPWRLVTSARARPALIWNRWDELDGPSVLFHGVGCTCGGDGCDS